eukprot:COSAG05_NODE_440_length_9809_cov_10.743769_4_plen_349_part_00
MTSVGHSSTGARPLTPVRGRVESPPAPKVAQAPKQRSTTPALDTGPPTIASPRVLFASGSSEGACPTGRPEDGKAPHAGDSTAAQQANPHLRSELEPQAAGGGGGGGDGAAVSAPAATVPRTAGPNGLLVHTGSPGDRSDEIPRISPSFVASKAKLHGAVNKITVGVELVNKGNQRKQRRARHLVRGLSTMDLRRAESPKPGLIQKGPCAACSARPHAEPTEITAEQQQAQKDLGEEYFAATNDEERAADLRAARQLGLTVVESELALDIFHLATDGAKFLTPEGLKELMRWFSLSLEDHQLKNVLIDIKHESSLNAGLTDAQIAQAGGKVSCTHLMMPCTCCIPRVH